MTWRWEYVPDEETVAVGAPAAFLAEVEKQAAELVRAAKSSIFMARGARERTRAKHAFVAGGFFVYMVTPRSELVSIWQVTPDPLT